MRKLASLFVVGLMIAVLAVPLFSGTVKADTYPTWNVGTKWALAGETDVGQVYDSMQTYVLQSAASSNSAFASNVNIQTSDFKGMVGSYYLFEVTGVTSTEYTLKITYALNMTISAKMDTTVDQVPTGTYIDYYAQNIYNYNYYNNTYAYTNYDHLSYPQINSASKVHQHMGFDAELAGGVYGTTICTIEKSTMGLEVVNAEAKSYIKGTLSMTNVPSTTYWYPSSTNSNNHDTMVNVTLENGMATINGDAQATSQVTFAPAMDLIKASMSQGNVWSSSGTCSLSGTYDGTFDVTGLNSEQKKLFFTDSVKNMGISDFPIDLSKITGTSGSIYNLGTIGPVSEQYNMQMTCLRDKPLVDPVFGSITTKELTEYYGYTTSEPTATFYYCPANGYLVRMDSQYVMGSVTIPLTAASVQVDNASGSVGVVKNQVDNKLDPATVLAGKSNNQNAGSSSIGGLDMTTLLIIVAVIAAAAVVGGAFVMMHRKKLPPQPPVPPTQ